ncbi:MAG: rhodanese-like domain-containing protein [Rhodoplanes sp.]
MGTFPARSTFRSTPSRSAYQFDRSQEIVAYCRGPYCVLSYEAVAALRAKGFKVRRLEDGLPEWRAAGFPVVAQSGAQ